MRSLMRQSGSWYYLLQDGDYQMVVKSHTKYLVSTRDPTRGQDDARAEKCDRPYGTERQSCDYNSIVQVLCIGDPHPQSTSMQVNIH